MILSKSKIYSTDFFKKTYGGNIQCSMPIINGVVPYCKFDPRINWNFTKEAWIEEGPLRQKSAIILASQKNPIPVFAKNATNKWTYIGKATFSIDSSIQYKNHLNKNPPRNKIQFILQLTFY